MRWPNYDLTAYTQNNVSGSTVYAFLFFNFFLFDLIYFFLMSLAAVCIYSVTNKDGL